MTKNDIAQISDNAIRTVGDHLISISQDIWKHPETGYREERTSALLVAEFEKLGIPVKKGLAMTGFRAELDSGKPGPVVAIFGEMDALLIPSHPEAVDGKAHSCGHNISGVNMLGAAIGLKAAMETGELCGKVVFIASPAEEGIELEYRKNLIEQGKIRYVAGKPQLISEGVLDDVDIAYMLHLSNGYGFNDHNGSVCKKIIFKGKSCHASRPHAGINALNGMNLALHALGLLRESYSNSDKIRFHGIVSEGGQSVNVIPDHVVMEYMLRAETVDALVGLNKRFDNAVLHAGLAAECEVEIQTVHYSMPLYDDLDLGKVHQDVVAEVAPGEEFDFNSSFYASCTDMGDIGTIIPSIHGYIPGMKGTSHSNDYYVADYDTAIVTGSRINARAAIELLADDAAIGRKIAAKKASLMPVKEYLSVIEALSTTVKGKI